MNEKQLITLIDLFDKAIEESQTQSIRLIQAENDSEILSKILLAFTEFEKYVTNNDASCDKANEAISSLFDIPSDIAPGANVIAIALLRATFDIETFRINKNNEQVYFIRNVKNGLIKIGFSSDPKSRKNQLKGNSYNYLIMTTIKGGRELEKKYHKQFEHLHDHDEWFKDNGEILSLINKINKGKD